MIKDIRLYKKGKVCVLQKLVVDPTALLPMKRQGMWVNVEIFDDSVEKGLCAEGEPVPPEEPH